VSADPVPDPESKAVSGGDLGRDLGRDVGGAAPAPHRPFARPSDASIPGAPSTPADGAVEPTESAGPQRRAAPRRAGYTQTGSWGRISEFHWSRLRKGSNTEALEYYRQRSKAPGVREGGDVRNFYCMHCDGVIPYQAGAARCPHCGAAVEAGIRRYFNWVEMEMPKPSDTGFLIGIGIAAVLVLATLGAGIWWLCT
jgi:hypothetical protein